MKAKWSDSSLVNEVHRAFGAIFFKATLAV